MGKIKTVLFDLDGTLLDTAEDMAAALNYLRQQHDLPALAVEDIRPHIGYGSRSLLKLAFDVEEGHERYPKLLDDFFNAYDNHLTKYTDLFPEMHEVLSHIEGNNLSWGIVTNKPERFTHVILNELDLSQRSGVVVCGDTLATRKPHPETILHACDKLNVTPKDVIYVGDAKSDVTASKAAGTQSLVALYGYINNSENPLEWEADGYINRPSDILQWL